MSLKSLDKNTIHRICSGQVIINLANAVKELVENSLDAGARSIEIKLKNYGSESIEVVDDGPGIVEEDFQTITLKHYTSKIQRFEDLEFLQTFGFRGEALSSLCALSNLVIVTRHSSSQVAYRIEYDKNGLIKAKTQCARSVGTSVILEKLFNTLPVRHKEFTKNLKKEYQKLMHVLQCYCLISEGIKLSCWNIMGDKSTKIMSTNSKNSLRENIIEIFGLQSMNGLIKFEQIEPDDEFLVEFKVIKAPAVKSSQDFVTSQTDSDSTPQSSNNDAHDSQMIEREQSKYGSLFKIDGFISSCSQSMGRSAPDRQYVYVNKRPCDHSKLTKLVNEVFHQFNRNQYPMFVLNISTDSQNVDVNVTPDKLQMFLRSENVLFAIIKSSLVKVYSHQIKSVSINESSFCKNSPQSAAFMMSFFSSSSTKQSQQNKQKLNTIDSDGEETAKENKKMLNDIRAAEKQTPSHESNKRTREDDEFELDDKVANSKQPKILMYVDKENLCNRDSSPAKSPAKRSTSSTNVRSSPSPRCKQITLNSAVEKSPVTCLSPKILNRTSPKSGPSPFSLNDKKSFFQTRIGPTQQMNPSTPTASKSSNLNDSFAERIDLHMCNRASAVLDTPPTKPKTSSKKDVEPDEEIMFYEKPVKELAPKSKNSFEPDDSQPEPQMQSTLIDQEREPTRRNDESINRKKLNVTGSSSQKQPLEEIFSKRKQKPLKFDLNTLLKNSQKLIAAKQAKIEAEKKSLEEINLLKTIKFKSKNIESKEAEGELDRFLKKEDFLRMRILGQFNKGFIITELESDIFIIDQHASDEIYNFEMLQRGEKIQKQRLLQPRYLELPASAESLLLENINLIEKFGYEVQVCTNRKVGNRIMISCVPMSKQSNKMLNMNDIDELLFILSESELNPGSISTSSIEKSASLTEVKSSSLRSIYASKACRKSVMIGDSLNKTEMKRIITHMNEIDQPWNCPHGRPTMRHLANINLLKQKRF